MEGWSSSSVLMALTVPVSGESSSDTVRTDSSSPNGSPFSTSSPTSGSSTPLTSPSSACPYSEMPICARFPSTRSQRWSSVNFRTSAIGGTSQTGTPLKSNGCGPYRGGPHPVKGDSPLIRHVRPPRGAPASGRPAPHARTPPPLRGGLPHLRPAAASRSGADSHSRLPHLEAHQQLRLPHLEAHQQLRLPHLEAHQQLRLPHLEAH